MVKESPCEYKKIIDQIKRLEDAKCAIVRIALPELKSVSCISKIKPKIKIPIIADVHFNYKIALSAIDEGVDGLRLNPGNIADEKKITQIAEKCKKHKIPIRIGVNSGSIPKDILAEKGVTASAMVESALREIAILERTEFFDIKISMKATDVYTTIESYRKLADKCDYPFHVGITEAGFGDDGVIKSSVGIGTLLAEGIGDTIRVSLTDDPVEEVKVGRKILSSLGLAKTGVNIISCPTCGRCEVDLKRIANAVKKRVGNVDANITVAIMGCEVNGPGEAKHADIGVACGKRSGILFRDGKIIKKVEERKITDELVEFISDFRR